MPTILDTILVDVRAEVAQAKSRCTLEELKARLADAPPVRSLRAALERGFGLIAEIKVKSPSRGQMRPENVADAPRVYRDSAVVRAVSVLTNHSHFGMGVEKLAEVRAVTGKPVLRKDFIVDPYQIYEARAHGADAILLMANVLGREQLREFYDLARSLGMDALFETHTAEQIAAIPQGAGIYGINSRTFDSSRRFGKIGRYELSAFLGRLVSRDFTTHASRFELIRHLPAGVVKVAESGLSADTVAGVRAMGFDAALVGNSLLLAPEGIEAAVAAFERALADKAHAAPR